MTPCIHCQGAAEYRVLLEGPRVIATCEGCLWVAPPVAIWGVGTKEDDYLMAVATYCGPPDLGTP